MVVTVSKRRVKNFFLSGKMTTQKKLGEAKQLRRKTVTHFHVKRMSIRKGRKLHSTIYRLRRTHYSRAAAFKACHAVEDGSNISFPGAEGKKVAFDEFSRNDDDDLER